jgi:hypothetical protein
MNCYALQYATYCPDRNICTGRDEHKQAREKNDSQQVSHAPLHTASANKPQKLKHTPPVISRISKV